MYYILAAVALWSTTGVLMAWGLRRQGHNFWIYAGLGLAYGPIMIVFLLDSAATLFPAVRTVADDHLPTNPDGWIDVLVGHDGSPETTRSIQPAIDLLGPAIRRLRLVHVLDYETGFQPSRFPETETVPEGLQQVAEGLDREHVEIVLLSGRPDEALVEHAVAEQFDLIIVAHRQHRLEAHLVGSTVLRLAKAAGISVLIGPSILPTADTATADATDEADAAEAPTTGGNPCLMPMTA